MPDAGFQANGNYATESGPVRGGAVAITKSDSTVYSPPLRGIYVGVTGTLVVTHADGTTATLTNLAPGVIHPVAGVTKVMAATTATGIVGWQG